jgi:carbon starvation protein CstA
MITFFSCVALLIFGYFFYSKFVEKILKIDPKKLTPAYKMQDGIDYIPISKPKNALINLLNIAGTGPVFGPILAALYGPVAMLWIVLGCIFAGAVHDFVIGIISLRNNGETLPTLAEKYLSKFFKHIVNFFSALLLILVATVFVVGPAKLIIGLADFLNFYVVIAVLFFYYFLATLMPIDKIIGKVYPFFGALLLISAFCIMVSVIFFMGKPLPELNLQNMHPQNLPIYPLLFLVLSCGALSGFHATQIPIVTRTIENQNQARSIFYGMMILEGIVALIWAYATIVMFDGKTLLELIKVGTPSLVVDKLAIMTLGSYVGTLAILGVIVLPVTSGATAFRGIRLMLAEYLNLKQKKIFNRLVIAIPCFLVSLGLCFVDFQLLWQYFSWANQTLAAITLWIATIYLIKTKKNMWITLIPALFITSVVITYILYAPIGFGLAIDVSAAFAVLCCIILFLSVYRFYKNNLNVENIGEDL